jgi:hypothetical protein
MQSNQNSDGQGIVNRLFASFSELEQAIQSARKTLSERPSVPAEVLRRIESYDEILAKQRTLANSLCSHIDDGNWDEVSRHVGLINGLSAMIRDDARAILAALSPQAKAPVEEDDKDTSNYC